MRTWVLLVSSILACPALEYGADTDARNIELQDYKTHFKTAEYKSRHDWEVRKAQLKLQILGSAGLLPMPLRTPLHPKVVRRFDYPDYSIEVILIETLPGYYLGGNLYLPAGERRDCPGILIPHGHWKHGRLEDQPSYSVPALGIGLARQGYVAFAYDMVGFNDTRQTSHSFANEVHELWSFHPMGLQLWNSIRALDYLQSLPQVDGKRIAVTGASGGASQTLFLSAVDDRVKVAAPVNMISAYMQGGDPCEEAPNLRLDTSNVEIAAMAAPRPMIVVSCTHDWTRHTPVEEFPAIRKIYALYGRPQDIDNVHLDAEHNYNRQSREAVYRFLSDHLNQPLPAAAMVEREYQLPPADDMLAFGKGDLPKGTDNFDDVFQSWKVAARMQTENNTSVGELRDALRQAMGTDFTSTVDSAIEGDQIILSRPQKHDRVSGHWRPGKGVPVLLVNPAGSTVALNSELGREILRSGRPVLMLDVFKAQPQRSEHEHFDKYFFSYHRSDDAERVQDIVTALAFLDAHCKRRPELIGIGKAGVWSLFAAAVSPFPVELIADLNGFSGSDQDFKERLYVPGIQRVGGLTTAMKLVNTLRATIPLEPRTRRATLKVD
jgi:dienelactone hydrolase